MEEEKVLWKARKRLLCGLPWTFTVYSLTETSLNVQAGFLFQSFEEIKLYRIRDFTVHRSLIQRMFGLGTIHVCSADSTSPEFDIINVKDCLNVKKLISDQVEIAKEISGVNTAELISVKPGGH